MLSISEISHSNINIKQNINEILSDLFIKIIYVAFLNHEFIFYRMSVHGISLIYFFFPR